MTAIRVERIGKILFLTWFLVLVAISLILSIVPSQRAAMIAITLFVGGKIFFIEISKHFDW